MHRITNLSAFIRLACAASTNLQSAAVRYRKGSRISALEIDILHPPILCVPADKRPQAQRQGLPCKKRVSAFAAAVPAISLRHQAILACPHSLTTSRLILLLLLHALDTDTHPSLSLRQSCWPTTPAHRQQALLQQQHPPSPPPTPAHSTQQPCSPGPVSPKQPPRSSSCITNISLS
jgi:hypothetical protein